MAPKFKKADTFDEYTTEKLDVVQNRLLGDYNAAGIYNINKKISAELSELKKVKKESYNNEFFCTSKTHGGRVVDFEISFKKNSETQMLVAELYVLEGVPKQGGRMMNILKTPIGKYTSEVTPDFVDVALKKFNVVDPEEDEGQERKEIDDEYITKRGMLLSAIDKLTADSYNVIYEDYFTQRINLLKATNNAYSKKILAIFNDEFNKISDFFLLDKKTKKVINYKAMNELLDKAFEDLYGLDEYAESEREFKQRLLPILTMFISGAERIDSSAKKSVLDNVPKRFKDDMEETLQDMKQAQESRLNPEVKESNKDMLFKGLKGKFDRIKSTVFGKGIEESASTSAPIEEPYKEDLRSKFNSGASSGAVFNLDGATPTGVPKIDKNKEKDDLGHVGRIEDLEIDGKDDSVRSVLGEELPGYTKDSLKDKITAAFGEDDYDDSDEEDFDVPSIVAEETPVVGMDDVEQINSLYENKVTTNKTGDVSMGPQ